MIDSEARTLRSLRERTIDVDLLMVLAALGAAVIDYPFEGAMSRRCVLKAHSHVAGRCWVNRSETWSTVCQLRSNCFITAISVASVFESTRDKPGSTS
jgi:hypothetical protein